MMPAAHGWISRRLLTVALGCTAAVFAAGIALAVLPTSTSAAPLADARDQAVFAELVAPIAQAATKDNAEFTQRLAALNLDSVFSAAFLASDPDMTRTKSKIAEARSLADFYHDRERGRRDEIIRLIDTADVSQDFKSGARKASNAPDAFAPQERMWSALSAYYDSLDNAADILIDLRGRWSITNGALHFQQQADLDRLQLGYAAIDQAQAALNAAVLDMASKRDDAVQYLGQPQPKSQARD
jgi:1,2-phenylacetyl-CoA epoxidase PaaB subunit